MNEREIVRIAVRASMTAMGAMLGCILAVFLMAAAASPEINIPGVHLSDITGRPASD